MLHFTGKHTWQLLLLASSMGALTAAPAASALSLWHPNYSKGCLVPTVVPGVPGTHPAQALQPRPQLIPQLETHTGGFIHANICSNYISCEDCKSTGSSAGQHRRLLFQHTGCSTPLKVLVSPSRFCRFPSTWFCPAIEQKHLLANPV